MPDDPKPTEPTWLQDWKNLRSVVEHEDGLVNQRLVWMLAFNGFLFTAFGLSLAPEATIAAAVCGDAPCYQADDLRSATQGITVIRIALALAGIGSAFAALIGISAAFAAILDSAHRFSTDHRADLASFYSRPISTRRTSRAVIQSGLLMPSLIAGIWVFVLCMLVLTQRMPVSALTAWRALDGAPDMTAAIVVSLVASIAVALCLMRFFWSGLPQQEQRHV